MTFLITDDAVSWATVLGTLFGAVSLVATVIIAVNTDRLSRRIHEETHAREASELRHQHVDQLREQKSVIRQELALFQEALITWSEAPSTTAGNMEPFRRAARRLVTRVEAAGGPVERLTSGLDVLEGQAFWLADLGAHQEWVASTFGDVEDDREWVAGLTNSMLDVVKDHVLEMSSSVDDFELLSDDFWIELADPGVGDASRAASMNTYPDGRLLTSAESRWVPATHDLSSQARIRALVRYKVFAEHTLELGLLGTFTNELHLRSREVKFAASMHHLMALCREDVTQSVEDQLAALDGKIARALEPAAPRGGSARPRRTKKKQKDKATLQSGSPRLLARTAVARSRARLR